MLLDVIGKKYVIFMLPLCKQLQKINIDLKEAINIS